MKLTVLTTMYYSADYLNEFYERITANATKITEDYEIIFVNDGSPDNSLEVAKFLFEKDSKVKIIHI